MTTPLRPVALVAHGIEPLQLHRSGHGRLEPVQHVTYPKGRACIYEEELGCITVLCRANPGPACYCHAARYEREIEEAVGCEALAA